MTNDAITPQTTDRPMTRDELTSWLQLHCGVGVDVTSMLDEYAGRTEDEMDALSDEAHGSIA